jgi:zinc protease
MMLGSVFSIWATPKPGVAIEKLETAIEAELESVRTSGPNLREVERTINRMQSEFVFSLEDVGGMNGVADRLNTYNHYLGDPNYIGRDWDRYAGVTPESVRLAASALSAESCVTVWGMPGAKVLADVPKRMDVEVDLPAEKAEGSESWRSDPPRASIQQMAELPVPVRMTLANGLTLLFLEQRHIPALSVNLTVQGGRSANPFNLPGLASFTTKMLGRGTVRRSQSQLAAEFEVLGAHWSIGSSASASTATLQVLTRRAAAALELFSDLILNPKFDEDEIEKMRRERQVSILQRRDNPGQLAEEQFAAALFGLQHPYGYPETGTEESNQKITRGELERFYSNVFRPNRSALAIVGDLSQSEAKSWAERYFGEWRPKSAATVDLAANQKVGKRIVIVDRPGSPQTQLMVGHSGIDRKHSDFLALEVMNGILGGTFSSRINTNLREVHGYTYGTNSHLVYRKGPGLFLISGQVRTDATAASLVEIFGEVERIRTTIAEPEELANAKEAFTRSLISRFNGNAGCASAFSELFLHELDLSHFRRALSQVNSVGLSDIRRVAQDHLVPENMLVVAVGDAGTIKSQLNASGGGLEMVLA